MLTDHLDEMPYRDHWIILHEEQSRTNPVVLYAVLENEADFRTVLGDAIRASKSGELFRGFKVQPYATKLVVDMQVIPNS